MELTAGLGYLWIANYVVVHLAFLGWVLVQRAGAARTAIALLLLGLPIVGPAIILDLSILGARTRSLSYPRDLTFMRATFGLALTASAFSIACAYHVAIGALPVAPTLFAAAVSLGAAAHAALSMLPGITMLPPLHRALRRRADREA